MISLTGKEAQESVHFNCLVFLFFAQAAAVESQPPTSPLPFVGVEAAVESSADSTANTAAACYANWRKLWFAAQASQATASQPAVPLKVILMDDPEAPTVFPNG